MELRDIEWTSFRTLEPNPSPYTPMTQSILNYGMETSPFIARLREGRPLATFHRGYLFFNVPELRRLLGYFLDVPPAAFLSYLEDDTEAELSGISVRPSPNGLRLLARLSRASIVMLFRVLTANRHIPERPPVESLSAAGVRSLLDAHLAYLTKMVAAHVFVSALAEAYTVGVERLVPRSPPRTRIQNLLSEWTHSTTSEMARRAANLETETQLEAFLTDFGHRCPREMEIAVPRWRDDPSTLTVSPETSPLANETAETSGGVRTKLARLALFPGSILERFRENPKNEWLKSYAYLRRLLLESGKRAVEDGSLRTPDDVFYLPYRTARTLLNEPPSRRYIRHTVAQARRDHESNRSYSPPLFATADFRRVTHRQGCNESNVLDGLGVSEGTSSGRAITARSPADVVPSNHSEPVILVTEFTDAGWTPLFFDVKGLVLERGSLLSHGSIVAREAGIAAVVNVDDALERIDTGDWITVDGNDGSVRLEDGENSSPASSRQ